MDSVFKINEQIEDHIEKLEKYSTNIIHGKEDNQKNFNNDNNKEIQELRIENQKLRYQLDILKSALKELSS